VIRESLPLCFESAAGSETGLVRAENQDAFLERRELGLWVVADGMGGHSDGQLASRMACDALADLLPPASIDQGVEAVSARLSSVNDYLFRMASRQIDPRQSGTTVIALLVRDGQCAVLWAGDSRLYRLRGGELRQLSEDHSWAGGPDTAAGEGTAITRAVGGAAELELEMLHQEALPGDRYLLCSDGVTRELDDMRLATLLANGDAASCCSGLLRAVLATPARDNATAIVVDVNLADPENLRHA
jgi:serine/threonine protein phosphatase PrpC